MDPKFFRKYADIVTEAEKARDARARKEVGEVNNSIAQQNKALGYPGTMQSWQNSLDAREREEEQARLKAMFPSTKPQANKPPVMKK